MLDNIFSNLEQAPFAQITIETFEIVIFRFVIDLKLSDVLAVFVQTLVDYFHVVFV